MPWLRLVVILTWTSFHRVGLALLFPSQIVFFWQFGYVTKLDATHLLNEDIANDKTKSDYYYKRYISTYLSNRWPIAPCVETQQLYVCECTLGGVLFLADKYYKTQLIVRFSALITIFIYSTWKTENWAQNVLGFSQSYI